MAKIYSPPDEIKVPVFNWKDLKANQTNEDKFINELKKYCKELNSGEYVGEEISIPHADGYARYMVASLKPVELIHLPLGDAWDSPHVDRMTAKDIKQIIDSRKKLADLFGSKK